MKWKELIKIAMQKGYRFHSHGKKHDIYVNEKGEISPLLFRKYNHDNKETGKRWK